MARDRLLLEITATLHHCGRFLNMGNASKSNGDIICTTEIMGLSTKEHALIIQILRNEDDVFGRRDIPFRTTKPVAMIRLANMMSHSAKWKAEVYRIRLREDGTLPVATDFGGDMTLGHLSFEQCILSFGNVFGISPAFRQRRSFGSDVV